VSFNGGDIFYNRDYFDVRERGREEQEARDSCMLRALCFVPLTGYY
jgi:hypothetical protein